MGTDKPWKVFERIVAKFFGGLRIVPSDSRSEGDVLHKDLYVECKCYLGEKTKPAIVGLYDHTAARAKREGKVAVVCLKRKGTARDFLIVCSARDLDRVYLSALPGLREEDVREGEADER